MKTRIKYTLFALSFVLSTALAFGQVIYAPYYGKNKVIYEKFNWSHYKTDHFDIYYYVNDVQVLKDIAEMAESAYQQISQDLKHPLSSPVPLIYYKTYTDFEQTNLFQVGEGVLGVSEPVLHRVAIHGDMPLDQIQHLIEHELSHIFEFDLLWGKPGNAVYAVNSPPDWIMEGFAEYCTADWSYWSSMIVRDAALNDRIPELTETGALYSRYATPRAPDYDFGHAMFDFIAAKLGKNGISEFWHSLKASPLLGRRDPIRRSMNMSYKQFNQEFKKYLRNQSKDYLLCENPEDYSTAIGPEFPLNPYYFSISHALSPSGDIVAVMTQNYKDWDIDILLFSTKDGSVIKNITKGFTQRYEYIKYDIDPSSGRNIAWSSSGDSIAFFARTGQRYSLFILDPLTEKILKQVNIPYDQPSCPTFFPGAGELLFTAFHQGIHDIYKVDLSTENIENLTENDLFEKAPAISPDGKKLAYTIRVGAYDKLFLSPVDNLKKRTQLTFGTGNTISPQFSPDSKLLYFSADMRGAFNIYSLNLETGELEVYTNVRTGNFFPVPVPNDPKKIIFASFNKGELQVFKSELEGKTEKTITFVDQPTDEEFSKFEPRVRLDINEDKIEQHKGMGKLYLTARPPIDTIVASDGSVYGGSAISFSDLLGDHQLMAVAYQVRSFRSYYFGYFNQTRRLQYMASAFSYTQFYYSPYAYYDPYYSAFLNYEDAIITRDIMGISFNSYYPFSLYSRLEASLGFFRFGEEYLNSSTAPGRSEYFWNGNLLQASVSLVGETTRFKAYGPTKGNTFCLTLSQSVPVSNSFFKNTNVEADFRQYLYLGGDSLLAFRFYGFASRGENPFVFYLGGNNQVRSVDYFSITATEGWYANLEFRLPLINIASTILGPIGPIRGTMFFDVVRAKFNGYEAKFAIYEGGQPGNIKTHLADAIGSYGYGFEFFLFGFPFHLEFAKMIELRDISRPFSIQAYGNFRTRFWIGYDF
jgi:Tol biopolymer transport system component